METVFYQKLSCKKKNNNKKPQRKLYIFESKKRLTLNHEMLFNINKNKQHFS